MLFQLYIPTSIYLIYTWVSIILTFLGIQPCAIYTALFLYIYVLFVFQLSDCPQRIEFTSINAFPRNKETRIFDARVLLQSKSDICRWGLRVFYNPIMQAIKLYICRRYFTCLANFGLGEMLISTREKYARRSLATRAAESRRNSNNIWSKTAFLLY